MVIFLMKIAYVMVVLKEGFTLMMLTLISLMSEGSMF